MAALILLALAILGPAFQGVHSQQRTVCGPGGNLNTCLAAIRAGALDTVNSRYGEAYFNRCPPSERFSINCFETDRLTEPRSLAQLALGVDSPDLSTIDRFLTVQYVSPAGSYRGCDHTYDYPNWKSFFINPVSDNAYPSWDLRDEPRYSWSYTDGAVFTLISRDPNGFTKHVVANIMGNDVANALHLYSYDGHFNIQNAPRPGTFMLYRQTRQLPLERIPSAGFNVTDFAERNQLQGPVAFSWVNALYDAYSVGNYLYGENCAGLVQDALRTVLPQVEYLPNEVDLTVFLSVLHTSAAVPYDCGMYTITPPPRDIYADPIDPMAGDFTLADLRPGYVFTMTMTMNKVNPRPSDFDGKLHTLMMVSGTTKNLHFMIVNIEGDNMTTESGQIHSWFAAIPPNLGPLVIRNGENHFFSLLVYEQESRIPATLDVTPYFTCGENREFSNMDGFITDHQLTLVGVSRRLLKDDEEYSICTQIGV